MKALLLAALVALAPATAFAENGTKPTCSAGLNTALPEAWKSWESPEAVPAAATPATQSEILIGQAYAAPLKPTASVSYAVQPRKTNAGTSGGLFMLTIDKAGVYTIGLDLPGWIDVVRDGKVVKSSGHGHGPDCSTIRKMVDFRLDPGHYTVQISNAPKDMAILAVVAK